MKKPHGTTPKIPTWFDYLAYDGEPSSYKWRQLGDGWHCPACERTKFELLRWTVKNEPVKGDPAKEHLTPFMGWHAALNEHHDHSSADAPRFEPVIICDQCNSVDAQVKARFKDMAREFSFAADEIRRIVTARPHQPHLVDYRAALQIYRAWRAAAGLCQPVRIVNRMQQGEDIGAAHSEARRMLEAFASVGATSFNLTWTNSAGEPRRSRKGVSLAEITCTMPGMLDAATANRLNLIVRPYGRGVTFIQLDDLIADKLTRPPSFLIIQTSPGSYQAWLAMRGDHSREFARRVRKGAGSDLTASGATRVAGSFNFKDKYAPDFPRVTIGEAQPGRMTDAAELERLGLVAPPDDFAPLSPALSVNPRIWPSYQKALDGAPRNRQGDGPDRSRADYVFAMTCISWGFGIEDTAARLMQESTKARVEGKNYADLTAKNAAVAVDKRRPTTRAPITKHGV